MTAEAMLIAWALVSQISGPNKYGDLSERAAVRGATASDEQPLDGASGIGSKYLRGIQSERDRLATEAGDANDAELPRPAAKRGAPRVDLGDADGNTSPRSNIRTPAASKSAIGADAAIQPRARNPLGRGIDDGAADNRAAENRAAGARSNGTVPGGVVAGDDELPPPDRAPADRIPVRRAATTPVETLAAAFATPKHNVVPGEPLALSTALARRSDRTGRAEVVHAYWKLAAATAAHAFTIEEHRRLADLPKPIKTTDQSLDNELWTSARAAAQARVHEAYLVVITSQHELAEAMGQGRGDTLPVTSDMPYLGAYATRFDELFPAKSSAPTRLRTIHETLPTRVKAIESRAEASQRAANALDLAEKRYLAGTYGIFTYLGQFNHMARERQAFLAVARAYNDEIADYAIQVARDGTNAGELTSMLIRTRATATESARGREQPPARSADTRGGLIGDDAWRRR